MKKELFLEQISNSEGQKLRLAEQRGTLIAEAKVWLRTESDDFPLNLA